MTVMVRTIYLCLWALVALSLRLPVAFAGPLQVPCESLSRLDYCLECAKPPGATQPQCYLCHPSRASVWKTDGTGTITACKAPTTGTNCTRASNDAGCAYCDGIYCIQCRAGFQFDANMKCQRLAWNTPEGCRALSKNPQCRTCTPDGACTLCINQYHVLVPLNAIYINAAGQGSQCMTAAKLQTEALAITGKAAFLPPGCREVDTEFKCNRCQDFYSLTGGKCVRNGNKCKTTLSYYQYCDKCDATGLKCLACNGSRSPPNGAPDNRCTFPCKQLFGIGCLKCNQWRCLVADPKYAKGRR